MPELEWSRRVRAAAAYAGLTLPQLAAKMQMSESTFRRHLERDKRPDEVRAFVYEVAGHTDLPEDFFFLDFEAIGKQQTDELLEKALAHARAALMGSMAELNDAIVEMAEGVRRREAALPPAPPGELGRRAQDSQPSGQPQQQPESQAEPDERRGSGG